MSNHLISEVLKIEAEADNLVHEAGQKAEQIIANIPKEINSLKAIIENKYHQDLEATRVKIAHLQQGEEERLKNEYEALKEKLNTVDNKTVEVAVHCVVKYLYES
jgi:vacuolar-type H+-ATPase subunit H